MKKHNINKEVIVNKKHIKDIRKSILLLSCGVIFIAVSFGVYGKNRMKVTSNSDFSEVIDFDGSSVEYKYDYNKIKMDFNKINFVKGIDRLFVKEDALWIRYPVMSSGIGTSGAMINSKLDSAQEYTLKYDIFFDGCDTNFDWQDGGMLSGLAGGRFYNGTDTQSGEDGFHASLMYNNVGDVYPLVYTSNDANVGGNVYQSIGSIKQGTWNTIKMYVRVNDNNQANGIYRVWLNDRLCFSEENIRYTTQGNLISISNLCAYNNETVKTLSNEQFVYIDNYHITNEN